MSTPTLASTVFTFSTSNRAAVRRAFLAHLERFAAQDRDVSWEAAPAAFARVYGESDAEAETTTSLFRAAMEELLDSGDIVVERFLDGKNRLVKA
jgi:hypothetical protein